MRIRRKKWAKDELETSVVYIDDPNEFKNKWSDKFGNPNEIHIEVGTGKGGFISELASNNPNTNYIAVDMIEAMLGIANRNIISKYNEKNIPLDNIFLIRKNVDYINEVFGEEDNITRIYINFCNPWPKVKHNKRRLTHPTKLVMFKEILKNKKEIYLKTDSDELFNDSIIYLNEEGFKIIKETSDLENNDIFDGNIETEHEKMFKKANLKIKALIAVGGSA